MLKIRPSRDRLIFNMGIPKLVTRHLYIERPTWFLLLGCFCPNRPSVRRSNLRYIISDKKEDIELFRRKRPFICYYMTSLWSYSVVPKETCTIFISLALLWYRLCRRWWHRGCHNDKLQCHWRLRSSSHILTLFSAWISNHMPSKVWDEVTYLSPNFNGCIVEV